MAVPILIVDDDADARDSLALAFAGEAFEVTTARDGQDALNRLEAGLRPAVIVLDLHMPVKSGSDLAAHLRAYPELAAIPVVGCSADPYLCYKASALGFVAAFSKPFDMDDLVATVTKIAHLRAA